MEIHKIINAPIDSNCFVITNHLSNKCIIIDPGTKDNKEILNFFTKKKLTLKYIILTHEHFDHCMGVNHLSELFDFGLICSKVTLQDIKKPKQNFSAYWEGIESFEINKQTKVVRDKETIDFDGISIHFIETPGHGPGSMCIKINEKLFTGDTLLNNTRVPLKLPGSNKGQHKASIEKLKAIIIPGMKIYPGHGEPFTSKAGMIN